MWDEKVLMEQLDAYFETATKEQLMKDLEETGCLEFMHEVRNELPYNDHIHDFNYNISGEVIANEVKTKIGLQVFQKNITFSNMTYNNNNISKQDNTYKNISNFFEYQIGA
ncbi:hypothetical protein [Paenibacillus sp. GP183]|uniref:hypothetical protein n=1 Tax=Paenibacillus sp. GP183 TaxID=1882751 RepID=UPI00089AEB83|nr:hypothetical protein [Paenibacillus sp. GP183]SEC41116.1 hypothetical protein SAMN05443246_4011 [Paenibacillus sp. GP183]